VEETENSVGHEINVKKLSGRNSSPAEKQNHSQHQRVEKEFHRHGRPAGDTADVIARVPARVAHAAQTTAMQQAGSIEPEKYLPVLQQLQYTGVTSNIRFDAKGDLTDSAVSLYKAENGEWQFLETVGGK